MPTKPKTFEECLTTMSEDKRATLEKLRKTIRSIVPNAEEGVSYGLAAFILNGKPIAGLAAGANHCAYYPMSGSVVESLKAELKNYETSKGTIRFPVDKPLPATLVRKLIKARMAEIEGPAKMADSSQTDPAVVEFLRELDHPLKKELEALRKLILGVSPDIHEGFKWNSPSFRTTDYFATINVHGEDSLRLILHTGAKSKASAKTGLKIADPTSLLKWLAPDRALVTFGGGKDIQGKRAALQAVVWEWIGQL